MKQSSKNTNKTAYGKIFEKEFFNSLDNIFVRRIKDDTLRFKNVKNACDFIVFRQPYLYLFELKTTKLRSLPFSNISQFQIDSLYHHCKQEGIVAGFVINFRSHNYQTYFLPADKAYAYYYQAERKSFPLEWVQETGIAIPTTLIRTRYRFDISPIFDL